MSVLLRRKFSEAVRNLVSETVILLWHVLTSIFIFHRCTVSTIMKTEIAVKMSIVLNRLFGYSSVNNFIYMIYF